ncbi:hypothetical protein MNBD_BACTEROID03-1888 [hydrothermal vent metagenome]|uniref:Uncharacterized protein n=1 Tax=hydrothermal vent metagenome TaxID=652676 RepID=A0A3B0U828_9ZZZZ
MSDDSEYRECPEKPIVEVISALVIHRMQHPKKIEHPPFVIAKGLYITVVLRNIYCCICWFAKSNGVGG